MTRPALAIALALLAATPVYAGELDARCRAYDRMAAERIKLLLDANDARATTQAYAAVSQLTSARIECGQARVDTALAMYRQLARMLERTPPRLAAQDP